MSRKILSIMAASMIAVTSTAAFTADAAEGKAMIFSYCVSDEFAKNHQPSEVDDSLFDKFLKYSLFVEDKDSLSTEQMELCRNIFVTERTYLPYVRCEYARKTIKDGTAPKRLSLDDKTTLSQMVYPYYNVSIECHDLYPDISYSDYQGIQSYEAYYSEYWLNDSGTERIITGADIYDGPAYEKRFAEMPDVYEYDDCQSICFGWGDIEKHGDEIAFYGGLGANKNNSADIETHTSDIWIYRILEDDSALIIGSTLPTFKEAEPIEETVILPAELDGHPVCGIENALSYTGVKKLVIPENYHYISKLKMQYLEEVKIDAPELDLDRFAFLGCDSLKKAELNVKSVESAAFCGCDKLETIIFTGAEEIGCEAFRGLTALENVTLPDNIKYIGQDAFAGTSVKELVIPKDVKIVGTLKTPYYDPREKNVVDPLTADKINIADNDCVIKSYYGTEAQNYAAVNNCRFYALDELLYGDSNGDGAVSVADAVSLQKYLLGSGKTGYESDLNRDGSVDVFDMVLLRQFLLG